VLAGLAVLAHLYGLYRVTGPPTPPWFPHADKLEHLVGFAGPVALVLLAVGLRARSLGGVLSRRACTLVAVLFGLHAVVSELAQHFFYTTRSGDPLDALADGLGVLGGVLLARRLLRGARHDPEPVPEVAVPSRSGAR
jgi:hypothetical protein